MSVLVQNLGDFIKVLIQAFNLSSMFPALIFVLMVVLFVLPGIPATAPIRNSEAWNLFTSTGVSLVAVGLIAYLLDAINYRVVRILEGYWCRTIPPFSRWAKNNAEFVNDTCYYIQQLDEVAAEIARNLQSPRLGKKRAGLESLQEKVDDARGELRRRIYRRYPDDPRSVLPLPLGNIIAAAEQYPHKTFGMNAVVLWPFLIPTLTEKNYSQFLLREKSMMDFLINLAVMSFAFGVVWVAVGWATVGYTPLLIAKMGLTVLASFLLLSLSTQAAASWGSMLKVAFVLFREDLRQALGARQPTSFADERQLWLNLSDLLHAECSPKCREKLGQAVFTTSSYKQSKIRKER